MQHDNKPATSEFTTIYSHIIQSISSSVIRDSLLPDCASRRHHYSEFKSNIATIYYNSKQKPDVTLHAQVERPALYLYYYKSKGGCYENL